MEEVTDEPLYRDRVCGIDIGKAQMVATIRVPSDSNPARRASETRSFGTTKREVLALADWLRCWQVPAVVMEATGDYWKGPFYRLEAEGFECVLADAKQVKNLPGRPKRDPSDSRWLAACFERGAVTACFVATPEFRVLAATVFAHESAAFGVHVLAGAGVDVRRGCRAGVGSGCAEEAGERGDGFEQQGVDAGLLVGGAAGAELGDGAAVLGLGGELADPGGHGGVLEGGRAAGCGAASRG